MTSKTIIFTQLNKLNFHLLQGGVGLVQDIKFSNIQVTEVQTPIIIDQFYCDKSTCRNQTSAVGVSGVQYENIRGTFTIKPVHFACSDSLPCSGISLTGVQLRPVQVPHYHLNNPFCWQAFGELYTPTVPLIACLQLGKPAGNNLQTYNDICWDTRSAFLWLLVLTHEWSLWYIRPLCTNCLIMSIYTVTLRSCYQILLTFFMKENIHIIIGMIIQQEYVL